MEQSLLYDLNKWSFLSQVMRNLFYFSYFSEFFKLALLKMKVFFVVRSRHSDSRAWRSDGGEQVKSCTGENKIMCVATKFCDGPNVNFICRLNC